MNQRFKLLLCIFWVCSPWLANHISAQALNEDNHSGFKFRIHKFQQTTLPYRLYIPENYNKSKSYPIILALHGAGERGTDNRIPIRKHYLGIAWAKPEVQQEYPCFIITPQCPKGQKWTDVNFKNGSYSIDTIPVSNEILAVMDVLNQVLSEFNINKNRQYVTGLSMGGYGTWDVISRYPNRFAAAVPMSGAGDPRKAIFFKNMPIWSFHNSYDDIVPVEGSRDMITALNKAGVYVLETGGLSKRKLKRKLRKEPIHIYTESMEGNHGPWEPWYSDEHLHKWLFAQSKK